MSADGAVGNELAERFRTITKRLQNLKLETDEVIVCSFYDVIVVRIVGCVCV